MVNFYQLLGVGVNATSDTIAAMIKVKRLQNQVPAEVLHQAEVWLLDKSMRRRYDEKLRKKNPEVFAQGKVVPRQTTSRPQSTMKPKRRKVGRWYLLAAILLVWLAWYIPHAKWFGFGVPASWQSIGLEKLEPSSGWHATPQAIYLTEQQPKPQWLWVWQKSGALMLVSEDPALRVCAPSSPSCTVHIQIDQAIPVPYLIHQTEHAWQLSQAAQVLDLSLRLQSAKQLTITWPEQEHVLVFETGIFPHHFLIDTPVTTP